MARNPKPKTMASKDIEEESALERVAQDETEYNSVSDSPITHDQSINEN